MEVEGENAHLLLWNGEAVDHGVGLVLVLHGLQHVGDDGGTGGVVDKEMLFGLVAGLNDGGPLFGQLLFVGLGVVVVGVDDWCLWRDDAPYEALAVAHHPYLAAQAAVDDARGGEPLFGMLGQAGQL